MRKKTNKLNSNIWPLHFYFKKIFAFQYVTARLCTSLQTSFGQTDLSRFTIRHTATWSVGNQQTNNLSFWDLLICPFVIEDTGISCPHEITKCITSTWKYCPSPSAPLPKQVGVAALTRAKEKSGLIWLHNAGWPDEPQTPESTLFHKSPSALFKSGDGTGV